MENEWVAKGRERRTCLAKLPVIPVILRHERGHKKSISPFQLAMSRIEDHVCIYGDIYSKGMDQPGKVANPARGQLNKENEYIPVRVRA